MTPFVRSSFSVPPADILLGGHPVPSLHASLSYSGYCDLQFSKERGEELEGERE